MKLLNNYGHILVGIPISFAGAMIIYANLTGRGSMWESDVVFAVYWSAITILVCSNFYIYNCLKYLSKTRSWKWASLEISISVILLILSVLGRMFACFPGTGRRIDNCGLDYFGDIALTVVGYLSIRILPISMLLPVMTILSTIVITIFLHSYTLWRINSFLDGGVHNELCVLSGGVYSKLNKYQRIEGPVTLEMIFPIGEGAPRIIFFKNGKHFNWKYSKIDAVPMNLNSDKVATIAKHCA